jgi:hypothetical protein
VASGDINLFGDNGRSLQAATGLALRKVFAEVNADSRWRGIEVRLKHERIMCLDGARFKTP